MSLSINRSLVRRRQIWRFCQCAGFSAFGAVLLGVPAWSAGLPWGPPASLGGVLAFLLFLLERPASSSLQESIDPASDPSGVLRAALSVNAGHPYERRLEASALGIKPRFLPVAGLEPLAIASALFVLIGLWINAGAASPSPNSLVSSSPQIGDLNSDERGGVSIPVDEVDLAAVPPTSFEQGRDWKEAAVDDSQSNILLPGRNLGLHRAAVERYWRLKGE